jgi:hypothetical protein
MIAYNTRFCPTVSGNDLHVGHLYTALVNEREAHHSGGKFIVRIDDTQEYWIQKFGRKLVDQFITEYRNELDKFLSIDTWELQSSMPKPEQIYNLSPYPYLLELKPRWIHDQLVEWLPDPDMVMYPYTARYTLEKVIWDVYENVNWLIRGEDLVTETSLYDFFVDILGLPRMRHTIIPRLRAENRQELMVMGISKSMGKYRLSKQLDKFGASQTLDFLKQS